MNSGLPLPSFHVTAGQPVDDGSGGSHFSSILDMSKSYFDPSTTSTSFGEMRSSESHISVTSCPLSQVVLKIESGSSYARPSSQSG